MQRIDQFFLPVVKMTTSGLYVGSRPFFSASPIKTAYFVRLSLEMHNVEISGLKVPDRAAEVKLGSADFSIFELKLLERVPKLEFKLFYWPKGLR